MLLKTKRCVNIHLWAQQEVCDVLPVVSKGVNVLLFPSRIFFRFIKKKFNPLSSLFGLNYSKIFKQLQKTTALLLLYLCQYDTDIELSFRSNDSHYSASISQSCASFVCQVTSLLYIHRFFLTHREQCF